MTTITWAAIALVTPYMLINGVVMLAAPSAWDALPKWLKVAGTPERSETFPLRHVYIRIVGAGILLGVAWILYTVK